MARPDPTPYKSSDQKIVFGLHAVRIALARYPETVLEVRVSAKRSDARVREILAQAAAKGIATAEVDVRALDLRTEGRKHQGVVAFLKTQSGARGATLDWLLELVDAHRGGQIASLLLVLDGVQDPHNLGACMRSAAAAGAHAVVVPRRRAVGLTGTVHKVASGGADLVPLVQVTNLARALEALADRGLTVVGAAAGAPRTLYDAELSGPVALVLGGEGAGLRRLTAQSCDWLIGIPMPGPMESLNVSVASGVILFEAVRQRRQKGVLASPPAQRL